MARKKLPELVSKTEEIGCGGCSVEEVVTMAKEFIKKLPSDCVNVTTNITSTSDGWSNKPVLEISWQRPPTPEDIQAAKAAETRGLEAKLARYNALKKELGL